MEFDEFEEGRNVERKGSLVFFEVEVDEVANAVCYLGVGDVVIYPYGV